jgi:hypothetical protein
VGEGRDSAHAQRGIGEPARGPGRSAVAVPIDLGDGWRIEVAEDGPQFERAERIEYEVFLAQQFCEPSELGRAEEYEPWRDASAFHVAVAPDGTVGGVVRTIVGPYDDLPVGKFERSVLYPADPVSEFASLAVARRWRRHAGVAEALYRDAWSGAVRHGATGLVAIGEDWLVDLLNLGYDFGFVILGSSRWYMGGNCFAIGASLRDMATRLSTDQPDFWRWFSARLDLRDRTALWATEVPQVIDLRTREAAPNATSPVAPRLD